jgi:hypothetical protein
MVSPAQHKSTGGSRLTGNRSCNSWTEILTATDAWPCTYTPAHMHWCKHNSKTGRHDGTSQFEASHTQLSWGMIDSGNCAVASCVNETFTDLCKFILLSHVQHQCVLLCHQVCSCIRAEKLRNTTPIQSYRVTNAPPCTEKPQEQYATGRLTSIQSTLLSIPPVASSKSAWPVKGGKILHVQTGS